MKETIDIPTLCSMIDQKLSYSKLCEKLNLTKKTSDSKVSQLKYLSSYCEIERTEDKKYIITEVYDDDIIEFIDFLNCPRQQLLFNIALYKQILANGDRLLFCSNTQLLKLLGEVNENFSHTFNQYDMWDLGEEYIYMQTMTKTVYNILMQWTRRKISNMGFAIMTSPAFRLYKNIYTEKGVSVQYTNVAFGSSLFSRCQTVMDKAIEQVIIDKKYLVFDEQTNERIGLAWMPEKLWYALEAKINSLTREEFRQEGYTRLNIITAFSPASGDTIQRKMENACKKLKDTKEIKQSVRDKIMATIQLNDFSMAQREKYIEYNINEKPPVLFREELNKIRKKKKIK